MIKPNIPNMSSIPGVGAMTDNLEFLKNLWGNMGLSGMPGMNIPGMVMPTLSVEEINKKITDLKAVESWLGLNMNMLRATIQALEVQAATLSTLQTMGESFTASMNAATGSTGKESVASADTSGASATGTEKAQGAPEPTSQDQSDAASFTAPLVNAAAWWNMLQEQFNQAVGSAMATEPASSSDAKQQPKATPQSKTATSAASAPGSVPRKRKTTK